MSDAAGSSRPDYYADLGLNAAAAASISAEDIKSAYRAAAKRAHPDAGGSAEAMERVNEAHRVLSDPVERRQYDRRRLAPEPDPQPRTADAADPAASQDAHQAPHHQAQGRHAHPTGAQDPAAFARMRRSQARHNALQILRRCTIASFVINILTRYALLFVTDTTARIMLKLLGFIPLYGALLSVIFLMIPQIRLDLFDLTQHLRRRGPNPHLSRSDRATLGALMLGFIPTAVAWIILT